MCTKHKVNMFEALLEHLSNDQIVESIVLMKISREALEISAAIGRRA